MRALLCSELGDESRLAVVDQPVPSAGPGQVRITMRTASVNFPDTLMIRGEYQMKPELPFVPGHELAGEVSETGDGVSDFAVGDRVLALTGFGAFAEEVVATPPMQQVQPIPAGMPWDEAAALNLTYGTAIHGLRQRGRIEAGEAVLVLGAAGGCGSAAIEVAKAMGATVIASASTEEKRSFARDIGADHVVTSDAATLRDEVFAATEDRGVDVVFDPVGADLFRPAIRCLAWNGRFLVVGFAGGAIPELAVNRTIIKSISVVGVAYGMSAIQDPAMNADNFRLLFEWYGQGKIRPRIDMRFPLDRAADALRRVHDREAVGKVVIER